MEKKLHFPDWRYERVDLLQLMEYVVTQNPGLRNTRLPVKAYQVVSHGQTAEEEVDYINSGNLPTGFSEFRRRIFREKKWVAWQAGIGGVFYQTRRPVSFTPMIDMEVVSSNNVEEDARRMEGGLKALNTDGSILRSGDVGRGGYFFVGHDPIPYDPYFWQFLGKTLSSFSVGDGVNALLARDLGRRLQQTTKQAESQEIAKEILTKFGSISSGAEREGVQCDPRWIAHRLIDGFTILRHTPGKSYEDKPLQVFTFH